MLHQFRWRPISCAYVPASSAAVGMMRASRVAAIWNAAPRSCALSCLLLRPAHSRLPRGLAAVCRRVHIPSAARRHRSPDGRPRRAVPSSRPRSFACLPLTSYGVLFLFHMPEFGDPRAKIASPLHTLAVLSYHVSEIPGGILDRAVVNDKPDRRPNSPAQPTSGARIVP